MGEESRAVQIGEVDLLPLVFFLLARGFRFGGGTPHPPHPRCHPGGTPGLLLYFLAHNFSLWARLSSRFVVSSGNVTSHDALQAYPRPYANGAVDPGEDLVDPGVDLRITQLLEEGTDWTTWPRIHPHCSRSLMERLNS
jgi:hypothetical protein